MAYQDTVSKNAVNLNLPTTVDEANNKILECLKISKWFWFSKTHPPSRDTYVGRSEYFRLLGIAPFLPSFLRGFPLFKIL